MNTSFDIDEWGALWRHEPEEPPMCPTCDVPYVARDLEWWCPVCSFYDNAFPDTD